ncbi:MAG TPA: FG-GAP-like repeat-containing protein, partial [Pyrinomonadaceae bacterium]|nr:FG-GAP-like repeat-containing protein [Pyrinomonadaceae bacterium]
QNIVRLEEAGNVDLSFVPANVFNPGEDAARVEFLSNSQILLSTVGNLSSEKRFIRLFTNGSADPSFNPPTNLTEVFNWVIDDSNRIVLFGVISGVQKYIRLNFDGSLDPTFDVAVTTRGTVTALAVQPDGKILVGGDFDRMNGRVRHKIARLNADGSLDLTFDAENRFNLPPEVITVQPDGKILVGGGAIGLVAQRVVRLNSDGSLDATFNVQLSDPNSIVYDIALDANGRILIGGVFSTVNGAGRTSLARLNSDGSLDASFNPIFGGNPTIRAILVLGNGQILVGGSFTGINGFNRTNLVRLNSDGSLDTNFNAGNTPPVRKVLQLANGQFVVMHTDTISRINSDGSRDERFNMPVFGDSTSFSGLLTTMDLQVDGSIGVGGRFDSVNGVARNNFARITTNGALDLLFFPTGANGEVNKIVPQADGRLIVGGDFSIIGNVERFSIARITTAPVRYRTKFDFDGDGLADFAVYRPSTNEWYILRSSDFQLIVEVFGIGGDIPAPADFDGDGRTDIAIFRPSSGDWWYKSSINGQQSFAHFGAQGDVPRPSDFTGDGRDDFVVFRPSENYWYRANSANGQTSNLGFGIAGDLPLIGDFNGDGKSDTAIFRPSTGDWWWQSSSDNVQRAVHWGVSTDIPAPADYDGDGRTDFAVYRPSTGVWYILNSSNNSFTIINFGIAEDKPVPADYDGDGRADIAVFRPSTGVWYLLRSTAGFGAINLGVGTDIPIPNAFIQR